MKSLTLGLHNLQYKTQQNLLQIKNITLKKIRNIFLISQLILRCKLDIGVGKWCFYWREHVIYNQSCQCFIQLNLYLGYWHHTIVKWRTRIPTHTGWGQMHFCENLSMLDYRTLMSSCHLLYLMISSYTTIKIYRWKVKLFFKVFFISQL